MTSRIPAISEILAVIIILAVSGVVGSILYLNYSENAADSIDIISDRNSLAMKKATELVDISFPTSFPGKVEFLIHNYSPKDVLNKDEFAVYIMDDMGNVTNGDLEKLEFYKKSGDDRRDMVRVESGNFAQASYTGIDCPEESLILVTPAKEIIEIPTDEPCACPTGETSGIVDGVNGCVPIYVDPVLCEELRGNTPVSKCLGFGQSTCDSDPDGDGVGECICLSTDSSVLDQGTCECVIDGATWNDDLNTCECRSDKVVKNGACACPDGEVVCGGACRAESQCDGFRCENDDTCKDGDICNGGECVTPECDDTNPCQTAGEICVDRQCVSDPNYCDPICTGGKTCVNRACVDPVDTQPTLNCDDVACEMPNGAGDACISSCEASETCDGAGNCVSDTSTRSCVENYECDIDERCSASKTCESDPEYCDPACDGGKTCVNRVCVCSENACAIPDPDKPGACKYRCESGQSCVAGECGNPNREAAIDCRETNLDKNKFTCWVKLNSPKWCADECKANQLNNDVCVNGECVCPAGYVKVGSNCAVKVSCDASNCEIQSSGNRCVSSCSGSETCQSGNCVEVVTTPGDTVSCIPGCERVNAAGTGCDSLCSRGEVCRGGSCERNACTGGRVLVNGQCEIRASCSGCYYRNSVSNDCVYRCAGNESCQNGRCKTTSCYGDDVFVNGRCVERVDCDSSKCQTRQSDNTCNNWCTDSGGTCTNGSCKTISVTPDPVVPTCDGNQCLKLNTDSTACVDKCTNAHQSCNGSGSCVYTSCPGNDILVGTSCQPPKDCAPSCQTLDRSTNTCTGGCAARQACESGTCVQKSCPGTLLLINGSCVTRTTCSSSSCLTLDTSSNSCKSSCTGYKKACSGGSCVCGGGKFDSGSSCDNIPTCTGCGKLNTSTNKCESSCSGGLSCNSGTCGCGVNQDATRFCSGCWPGTRNLDGLGGCQSFSCPSGKIVHGSECRSLSCPSGHTLSGRVCEKNGCTGTDFSTPNSCWKCPIGFGWNGRGCT